MSLTGRFSALFLSVLALVLVGFLDGPVRLGARFTSIASSTTV